MGYVLVRVPVAAFSAARLWSTGWELTPQLPAVILSGFAVLRGWHCSVGAAEGPAARAGGSACARAAPSFSVPLCKLKIPASLLVGQQCSVGKCHCKWRHKQLEGMADTS